MARLYAVGDGSAPTGKPAPPPACNAHHPEARAAPDPVGVGSARSGSQTGQGLVSRREGSMARQAVEWRGTLAEGGAATEVLVVGAGPVGLVAALSLAQHGVRVRIIDEERGPAARSYALALHPRSLRLLDTLGVAEELVGLGHRLDRVVFFEGAVGHATVDFSKLRSRFPFALVIPQQAIEGALVSALAGRGVEVGWGTRLAEATTLREGVVATLERLDPSSSGRHAVQAVETAEVGWVVGADGHRSRVRALCGARLEDVAPHRLYTVFEFSGAAPHAEELWVVLDGATATALWPVGVGRCRFSFQLDRWSEVAEPRAKSRRYPALGNGYEAEVAHEDLVALAQRRAPWYRGKIGEVVWSSTVRFEVGIADRFGRGRLWLCGDAAHLVDPIGVASMNVGLHEAHELAARLARVLRDGASPQLLTEYDQACQLEWRTLLGLARGARPRPDCDPWVEMHAGRLPECIPASGPDLAELLLQIGLEL